MIGSFDIEEADIGDPQTMIKFVAAVTVAGVTVMQLVKARDGTTDQQLADALEPDAQPVLEALSAKLEGSTALQFALDCFAGTGAHSRGRLARNDAGWRLRIDLNSSSPGQSNISSWPDGACPCRRTGSTSPGHALVGGSPDPH